MSWDREMRAMPRGWVIIFRHREMIFPPWGQDVKVLTVQVPKKNVSACSEVVNQKV